MNKRPMIRLALVGCGEHAETGHAIPLARYKAEYPDEIALVAACDIRLERAQRFCERYGFQAAYGNTLHGFTNPAADGSIARPRIRPSVRAALPFEGGALGIQVQALVFAPFVANSEAVLVAGGGPVLTLGNHDRYFNLGVLGYVTSSRGQVVIPHLGFSTRLSSTVRIGAEAYLPGAYGSDVREAGTGKLGVVVWGVRLIGTRFWGDVALVDLICDGCGGLYKVLPLGIPFLNFGLGW